MRNCSLSADINCDWGEMLGERPHVVSTRCGQIAKCERVLLEAGVASAFANCLFWGVVASFEEPLGGKGGSGPLFEKVLVAGM